MSGLNLPPYLIKVVKKNGKNTIFDRLRKRYIILTPEEYVRQHFVEYLIQEKYFPEALLANEVGIVLGKLKKRCDTIVYDRFLMPIAIVEYKSPSIAINQGTFDQIVRYNMRLKVPWLIVSNGLVHYCCNINLENESYEFVEEIPKYDELLQKKL
ncbi:hypothetical protein AwDysgo_19600 [Bacteroidales bacterium]|nr:hypothetical protein AwDysgo_19600 [Bacteroidales bacterium]